MKAKTSKTSLSLQRQDAHAWSDTGKSEADAALALGNLSEVAAMSIEKLLAVKSVLGHGHEVGVWESPAKWNVRSACERRINLRERVISHLEKEFDRDVPDDRQLSESDWLASVDVPLSLIEYAVLEMTKILILCRIGPSGLWTQRKYSSLAPSNVARIAYLKLPVIFAVAIRVWREKHAGHAAGFAPLLSHLAPEHFGHMEKSAIEASLIECKRISRFVDMGLLFDAPSFKKATGGVTAVAGDPPRPPPEKVVDPYQRLPDEYVSEMGGKSQWITKSLAPNVICLLKSLPSLYAKAVRSSRSTERYFSSSVTELLARHVWIDERGEVFEAPPFKICLRGEATAFTHVVEALDEQVDDGTEEVDEGSDTTWPPRTYAQLMGLVATVQRAHIFIVLLSDGARHGELLAMRRNCLVRAKNGRTYANGLTFKLVDRVGGQLRDWVLPQLAVEAIAQQVRLVETCDDVVAAFPTKQSSGPEEDRNDYLWLSAGGNKGKSKNEPLNRAQGSLILYAKQLGMEIRPGGRNIHPHRFRKTLAWLCALAVTHSPKILKDVFGHKSFEMTLYYILSDKTLSVEVQNIARELRVMVAKETVDSIVAAEELRREGGPSIPLAGFGGGAAKRVADAVVVGRENVFQRGEQWGEMNSRGLAQTLTMHGRFWEYVRPGVICIKIPGQMGRCNMHRGDADPAGCKSDCEHRLEQQFLMRGVDENISVLVRDYGAIKSEGDFLTLDYLAEQIRQQVVRFPELNRKWSRDVVVREVMDAVS